MARRARLDAELVRRKLARSREQAAALVAAGRVQVRGTVAGKVATMIDPADPVVVTGEDPADEYVSRGSHKLAGALKDFPELTVADNLALARTSATAEQMTDAWESITAVQLTEYFPDGLDTVLGEHGLLVNPSLAQQIALARLALGDAPVAITRPS